MRSPEEVKKALEDHRTILDHLEEGLARSEITNLPETEVHFIARKMAQTAVLLLEWFLEQGGEQYMQEKGVAASVCREQAERRRKDVPRG